MGIEKLNTAGCHPQTDGLVERFHSTLFDMLSISLSANMDIRLGYACAICLSDQCSIKHSLEKALSIWFMVETHINP